MFANCQRVLWKPQTNRRGPELPTSKHQVPKEPCPQEGVGAIQK